MALFSATLPAQIQKLAEKYLNEPVKISINPRQVTVADTEQRFYRVREETKLPALSCLLETEEVSSALIFVRTKARAQDLADELMRRGLSADSLHGDLNQSRRELVLDRFRGGRVTLLVATDVAARGIDVDDIEVVINYDLPQDEEYYVHRIGRTGRAGRSGKAYTFVVGREIIELKNIQHYAKANIVCAQPPSLTEVTQSRVSSILAGLKDSLGADDLTYYVEAVEQYLEDLNIESPSDSFYTTADLAAALLRLAMGEQFHQAEEIEPVVPYLEHVARNIDEAGRMAGRLDPRRSAR